MAIRWNASRGPTLGVEWELQLIDASSRQLRQDAREIIAAMAGPGENGGYPRISYELMQSTLEVATGVCSTVPEAKADLAATIAELQRHTASRGILLACSGTHPVSDWRNAKVAPVQRYAELAERLQWLGRRLQTFSVQVHVGLRDGSRAIPIVNALAAYLPHFLALTASSPFWDGQDTGLASVRPVIFGDLPMAGPPHLMADWDEFEECMATLLRAGTIRSIKEVWWDIRPRPDFGTVEIRIFDGVPTAREVGMAAALSQSLVQFLDMQMDRGCQLPSPPSWVVHDNRWRAIRYGLDAEVITDGSGATATLRDELHKLVRELEPVAERLGCLTELQVASEVLGRGASYERQRAVLAHTGDMTGVVDALIAEFEQDRFVIPEEGAHGRR